MTKKPVTDVYHGVSVVDDYRWLEAGTDPRVRAWSDAENAVARGWLDGRAERKLVHTRVAALTGQETTYRSLAESGGKLFALKRVPGGQQSTLVLLPSLDDLSGERVIFDPAVADPSGSTYMDWFVPSHDGSKVAVSLSQGGSEDGTLHVFDVASGKETGDVIPRVQYGTGGGSVAWVADDRGLYYTRYPHKGERPDADLNFYQQVSYHPLGGPVEKDPYVVGKEFPRIAEVRLIAAEDGAWTVALVAHGDGGDFESWIAGPDKGWRRLAGVPDRVVDAAFGKDGGLYLRSLAGAPHGKILRLHAGDPLASAKIVVSEGEAAIAEMAVTKTRVYLVFDVGGPTELRAFDLNGNPLGVAPSEPVSAGNGLVGLDGDVASIDTQSFLTPPARYTWKAGDAALHKTAIAQKGLADFSDCEVQRVVLPSKDGAKVPLMIVRKKGTKLDGANPTLLTGYGGYGISEQPGYWSELRVWVEQGGVFADACLRGGGEFGDAWHDAGRLTHKQNVFDDFEACAHWLIEQKLTSPAHLAIMGGSNGGLLMGAAFTQHPELYRACVSAVGIYDMLRVENDDNGQYNTTEFGSVKDEAQFRALYGYSPYHHVKDGAAYPAILFTTGANDPRVNPYHSRKMIARLQAASSSKLPILLRTSSKSGHGIGSSLDERVELATDTWTFLFAELGVKVGAVATPAEINPTR